MQNEKEIRYADLFGGVGGFRLGIKRSGIQSRCVFYNDNDKYAVQTYNKNFGENWKATDIRTIKTSEIPEIDMLCGGFPCQAFSIAGKRRGFNDTRGTLFFEIARIIKAKRPKIIFLENVKGLLNHEKGETFSVILQTLSELGYDVQWMVLNSKFFGVPQNRERVFIIGNLRGKSFAKILPFRFISEEDAQKDRKKQEEQSWVSTLDSRYGQRWSQETYVGTYRTHKDGKGFRKMRTQISPTIPSRAREDGSGQPIITIPVLTPDREKKRQHGRRFKENGDPSFTLTGQDIHGITDGIKIRRLTPIECERLQGFPDNWTTGVSDTQRYKMMGNAVTINVIEAIARCLMFDKKGNRNLYPEPKIMQFKD